MISGSCRDCSGSVVARLEEAKERVRALAQGGDLEDLIHEAAEEMKAALAAELIAVRREQAASKEAGFSPSGVPGV
jgi:hypothetical protein